MLKFFIKASGVLVALGLSGGAYAMGMGGINVTTSLGEPLKAEIDLMDVSKADKSKLSAHLASPDAFKGAGLDYPGALLKFKFQIETRPNGDPYIKVTTSQPVNEPFVSLLVELTGASSGQLLREYTFLLDPPGFKPVQPKAVEVRPIEPGVANSEVPKAAEPKAAEPVPMRATAPMDEKAFVAAGVAPARKSAASSNAASGAIKVQHGDTLSKIARETKAPDVSLERMLVAMYRANEDAFDGNNMNRLRTGKILRVPEQDNLNKVTQVEAVKEIHIQAADWHAYRMQLAAANGSAAEESPRQEASGKISTTVADKTPAAKGPAKEVVRLSKGEAPGDKSAAGGNAKAMQDKMHALEEEATARSKALKDSNERIAMLEKNIKEMQRLLELKGQPVAPAKPAQGKVEEPAPVKAAAPEAKPALSKAEGPEAAKPEVTVTPLPPAAPPVATVKPVKPAKPKVVAPPPSLLDDILAEPLYLAGGAAALLGLGGLVWSRRRSAGSNRSEETGSHAAHISEPVAPSPDTGDFTQAPAMAPVGAELPEDVDPLSEADLFLNFGRDVQAEDILKDALKKNPGNQPVRLKLMSIYADRKDARTFANLAQQVLDSGDTAAWAQAAEMGRKLEPGNPLYGGNETAAEVAGSAAQEEVGIAQPANLDFDLGLGAAEATAAAADVTTDTSTGLDFDLGAVAETVPEESAPAAPSQPESVADVSVMDFDMGFEVPAETAAPAAMDFPGAAAPSEEPAAREDTPVTQETPMDFDITSASPQVSEQPEQSVPSLDDLIFDVTAAHPVIAEEVAKAEAPAEPAEDAMAFTLDFPTEATEDKAAPAAVKAADDIGLGEINLNLDVPASPASAPAEEVKDAHWHDVATKLDLARAYQEMGDASGASEILQEVLNEGDAQQRAAAEVMMQQLSA